MSELPPPHRPTDSNRWHIHVDGTRMNTEFESFLASLGFMPDDFVGGSGRYAPVRHMTWKGKRGDILAYKQHMSTIRSFLERCGFESQSVPGARRRHVYDRGSRDIFYGYIEGEYIPLDDALPETPFDPSVAVPFRLRMRELVSGFRESEVHVSMDQRTSDARLVESLRAMGMYDVLLPKVREGNRVALIMTVQSASRQQMHALIPLLHAYLLSAGGSKKGSIKEEVIADWIVSHPDVLIPPVIGDVER